MGFLSIFNSATKNPRYDHDLLSILNALKSYVKNRCDRGRETLVDQEFSRENIFEITRNCHKITDEDLMIKVCIDEHIVTPKEVIDFAITSAFYGYFMTENIKIVEGIAIYINNIAAAVSKQKGKK